MADPVERETTSLSEPISDAAILNGANGLARQFYRIRGYEVPEGYRFDRATHPQEREAWAMAAVAFEELTGTDINEVALNVEEDMWDE